jgi:hypothetical protein
VTNLCDIVYIVAPTTTTNKRRKSLSSSTLDMENSTSNTIQTNAGNTVQYIVV